jgi:NAD(P)H-flavin reductase/ferredoxin
VSGPAAPAVLTSQHTAYTVAYTGADPAPVSVTVRAGETVLLAGLRAGVPLPYECASGGCGSCKARLVSGALRSLWEEAPGLSERDRRKSDRVLLCQSVPEGDCEIRVSPASTGLTAPAPARTAARLLTRRQVCADTMVITVGTEAAVDWLPGQFVHLEFPDGVRRAYSMTHPAGPDGSRTLEFLVRAKPEGRASAWLSGRLAEGDDLVVEGPYGKAHAQSPADRPVVCLAGGTGLAPILAIADRLQEQSPGRSLRIYVGARTADDVVLTERLAVLGQRGADVVIAVDGGFGRDHDVLGPMRCGMALDHLVADVADLSDHDVYLAGPPAMVEASLRRLVRDGTAPADRLFVDKFL